MDWRRFGWTGSEVPVIGQGTWKMEGDAPAEALAALQAGLDAGMTHVDTAELYGGGRVESLVGRAIAGRRDAGLPRLQGDAQPREPQRDDAGVRGQPAAAGDRSPRLLPPALARAAPARGHHRRVRAAGEGGEDPDLGAEQLRRRRPRGGAGRSPGRGGSPATRCSTTCGRATSRTGSCRGAWSTRWRWWATARSAPATSPRSASRGGKVLAEIARAHGATPHQVALAFLIRDPHRLRHPQVVEGGAGPGQRRGGGAEALRRESPDDRGSLPGPPRERAADALTGAWDEGARSGRAGPCACW